MKVSDGDETRALAVLRPTGISRVNPLMERCDSPVQGHDENGIAVPAIGGGTCDCRERLDLRTEEALAVAAGAGERDTERSRVHWLSLVRWRVRTCSTRSGCIRPANAR